MNKPGLTEPLIYL